MNLFKSYTTLAENTDNGRLSDTLLTLMIIMIAGAYYFGYRGIVLTVICIASAVLTEFIINYQLLKNTEFTYRTETIIYSIIFTFILPANAPIWIPVLGGIIIVLVEMGMKKKFGCVFTSPAVAAAGIINLCFFMFLSDFPQPFSKIQLMSAVESSIQDIPRTFVNLFIGKFEGSIGTTCIILLILCGAYLTLRKIISWKLPVFYISICGILGALLWHGYMGIFINGAVFASIYSITDFAPDKRDTLSQLVYAGICAVITIFLYFILNFKGAAIFSFLLTDGGIFLWYKISPVIADKIRK